MTWLSLIFAGLFEVVGVMGITQVNQKPSFRSFAVLIGGFSLSFFLLSFAMKEIPMGTAYAVWTGIGTVGSALVGMLFYGEAKDKLRILCIAMVIIAVAGLKLVA
ncbi:MULTISPECIES: multidrug efflux SMR transporter [Bacillales]|uniref:Multidrug efflux SMR transporter n=1 Tax=Brevibacillus antibioticus TaxID=2570228 RepID=A0A4U2YAJ0_9BACL|nr:MULTISPECIES: multidrug efflux SMR transporter [Bacillales]KMZ42748.1 multidrug resistance protein SMR [Bacillus sp. FJAT-27238]NQF16788.1 multidrug efflux SMR transporter [Brevibacillus sp. HB1.3]NRR05985.1 multidrug efflux SMR transporter [Brevibacillus sp. RS1.1]NRS50844.1 multidrug efflux SMR transporter [Brevibacillus sp. HB2.2]TKI57304.1 multidrug efflux SMR transporter [Brevibacillus antibioticus]